jgi:outer membrane protein OmpA-like peptidoglycan-associated protein
VRLATAGKGESQPVASNASDAGRQLNRRVEIYVEPVVEG